MIFLFFLKWENNLFIQRTKDRKEKRIHASVHVDFIVIYSRERLLGNKYCKMSIYSSSNCPFQFTPEIRIKYFVDDSENL